MAATQSNLRQANLASKIVTLEMYFQAEAKSLTKPDFQFSLERLYRKW